MKVYVDDVDRHFTRAKAQGASIISGPEDGFRGGRIYRALDHEGNQWEISRFPSVAAIYQRIAGNCLPG